MTDSDFIELVAGRRSDGEPVIERVPATRLPGGRFRLVASPILAQGFAAGDLVVVEAGVPRVVQRGGNLCVHVYFARTEQAPREFRSLVDVASAFGGRVEGGGKYVVALTVPVSAGFAAVEGALNKFVERVDGAEWYFSNVYDPVDGVTPLNWW